MSKTFAELAGFSLADVKSVLVKMKKKEKKKAATGGKSKKLPIALLLAPTFVTYNVVSTHFSFTETS